MCVPLDPACIVGGITDVASGSAFQSIADSTGQAAGDFLVSSLTWWVSTPSVDPTDSTIATLQARTVPLVVIIMMVSVLVQAIRMIITRKKDPLVTVGVGLLRYFLVNALGITVIAGALQASDALSSWLVAQSMNDFATHMQGLLSSAVLTNPFALLALGALGFILAVIQWLLGFLRQAGILVLAVMLPLAASGSLTQSTRIWLNRMLPWMVSLIVYKPCAALIYSVGFSFMANGQDLSTVLTGIMILILACIAMPTLLKFFSWGGVELGRRSGGGGGGMMGAVGAMSLAGSSSGSSGVTQAAYMDAQGPQTAPPSGASLTGGGASVGPDGAGPAAAATQSGVSGASTSAAGAGASSGVAGSGAAGGATAAGAAAAAGPAAGAVAAGEAAHAGYQAAQGAASNLSSNPTTGE